MIISFASFLGTFPAFSAYLKNARSGKSLRARGREGDDIMSDPEPDTILTVAEVARYFQVDMFFCLTISPHLLIVTQQPDCVG